MTDINVYAALRDRYESSEEWVGVTEARAASWKGNDGQCDYIAINTFASRGFAVHGHEVKVSRNDWLRELKNPSKAERFIRFCDRWWLVVPAPWKQIVDGEGELPEGWGLMEVGKANKIRIVSQAPKLTRTQPPWDHIVGWMSRRDRQEKRSISQHLAAEFHRGVAAGEAAATPRMQHQLEALQKLVDEARALAAVADIRLGLNYDMDDRVRRLGVLWKLTETHAGVEGLVRMLDGLGNTAGALNRQCHALRDGLGVYLGAQS